jgi:cytoskeletal protein CcmA (bactofilin family)
MHDVAQLYIPRFPKNHNDLQSTIRGLARREERGPRMDATPTKELATLGKSVMIKGELSGSEDLYIDGQVEGTIDLKNFSLTVGPNGKVKANISAKAIVILGKVDGSLTASDRLDLRKSAIVTGDVTTQRIAIEEGAFLKGKVDIQKGSST